MLAITYKNRPEQSNNKNHSASRINLFLFLKCANKHYCVDNKIVMGEEFSTPRPWRISVSSVAYIRHGRGVQTRRAWRREFPRRKMGIEAWRNKIWWWGNGIALLTPEGRKSRIRAW